MNKEIERGKYVLIHKRYIDDMGFEKDSFDLFNKETKIHYPFMGKIKTTKFDRNTSIGKIGYTYIKKDYQEMMNEQIEMVKKLA